MLIIQRPTVEAIGEEEDNRQKFAVGPLDPGFGHTLGNSLRRTLLSSIPGAAITQVRFDEALHEFTTLPGVKEDVTDIILNLKDLLFKVHSDEPVTIRLDKRGPGAVTAGDLQLTSDVEVLSPDQHIASLNGKGHIAVDLTVERGRGYLSADKNKGTGAIGVASNRSLPSSSRASSMANRRRFVAAPPGAEKPPRSPRAATMRWQGTTIGNGLRPSDWPTARAARAPAPMRSASTA